LTYIRDTSQRRVIIDAPSITYPGGGIWGRTTGTDADAVSLLNIAQSWGTVLLIPPVTALYVNASGAATPTTTVDYYERAHTFMAAGA
jgi:hypothetical protein